jgi:hypothetical protein
MFVTLNDHMLTFRMPKSTFEISYKNEYFFWNGKVFYFPRKIMTPNRFLLRMLYLFEKNMKVNNFKNKHEIKTNYVALILTDNGCVFVVIFLKVKVCFI